MLYYIYCANQLNALYDANIGVVSYDTHIAIQHLPTMESQQWKQQIIV